MPKFKKKPVVIEARQLTIKNQKEISEWCGSTRTYSNPPMREVVGIVIPTLEGEMQATYGDWIIQGVQNEFYPCKPDIFEKTYEPVDE